MVTCGGSLSSLEYPVARLGPHQLPVDLPYNHTVVYHTSIFSVPQALLLAPAQPF